MGMQLGLRYGFPSCDTGVWSLLYYHLEHAMPVK